MEEELQIQDWDIFTVLNHLFNHQKKQIHIQIPFLKKPLFLLELKGEKSLLQCNYSVHEYEYEHNMIQDSFVRKEIPEYATIKEMFVQAGIIKYPNMTLLRTELSEYCERDFMAGDRPIYIGLDTNLYRDRFYSTQYSWLKKLPHNKIGFSISPYVREELCFLDKYKKTQVDSIRRACIQNQFKKYLGKFLNQNFLFDRKKRLGYVEIEKAHYGHWIILLPHLDENELQKKHDSNIIFTYQKAVKERNVDIILLSRDNDFIAQAEGIAGIRTFLVETPKTFDYSCEVDEWYHLVQLIYILALHYGIIEFSSEDVRFMLMGIWTGKDKDDWEAEALKIIFPQMNKKTSQLYRNLKTLRQMKWRYE